MLVAISPRDPNEQHRASTTLELFYDLATVVAISAAAAGLHHALAADHILVGLMRYLGIFFVIWWTWMNFTWFSSAFDNGDTLHVIAVFALIFGACLIASGVSHYYATGTYTVGAAGWLIQRIVLIFLWMRAGLNDSEHGRASRRFATALGALQALWILAFLIAPAEVLSVLVLLLVAAELLLPLILGRSPWNREHIVERHGLLMIIVLGEGILSIGLILTEAFVETRDLSLLSTAVAATIIVCAMWWIYFSEEDHRALSSDRSPILWSYLHFPLYVATAAVAAGLALAAEGGEHVPDLKSVETTTIAIAIFVLCVWLIFEVNDRDRRSLPLLPLIAVGLPALTFVATTLWLPAVALLALSLAPAAIKHFSDP